MLERSRPLLLIGGGKMGEALLAGWLRQGAPREAVLVVEPAAPRRDQLTSLHGIATFATAEELPAELAPAVLLLAVKPQMMAVALPSCAPVVTSDTLVLSIAAGTPISRFARAFGADRAIVRAMPNTPALLGAGATALCANAQVSPAQRTQVQALFEAVGTAVWVDDETLMDTVTATSGSGPAYVFALMEAMQAAAVAQGLPAATARALIAQTVLGAGRMLVESGEDAATLRRRVTSPGGVTEQALRCFAEDGFDTLLARAIATATTRGAELAAQYAD